MIVSSLKPVSVHWDVFTQCKNGVQMQRALKGMVSEQ